MYFNPLFYGLICLLSILYWE